MSLTLEDRCAAPSNTRKCRSFRNFLCLISGPPALKCVWWHQGRWWNLPYSDSRPRKPRWALKRAEYSSFNDRTFKLDLPAILLDQPTDHAFTNLTSFNIFSKGRDCLPDRVCHKPQLVRRSSDLLDVAAIAKVLHMSFQPYRCIRRNSYQDCLFSAFSVWIGNYGNWEVE